MKTTKLKFSLLPLLAVLFAITSAFSTSANTNVSDPAAIQDGYIMKSDVCEPSIPCSLSGAFLCEVNNQQVYGKLFPLAPDCPIKLRRD
ncbi:DUF6520 family protein [Flavobacteriaceae bacterium F08102]|nr:DUF6520 family protein [Flavobacteriaceae bacterium F08102]